MKDLIENEAFKMFFKAPVPGDIVKGKVIGKEKSALFLDIGNFGTGVIYGKEFFQAKDAINQMKMGDEILAKVTETDNEDGFVELSISKAKEEETWLELENKKEKNESFNVKILKANKGGLLTKVGGVPAFLPVSQLSPENYPKVEDGDQSEILRRLQKFIGKEIKVKIINLNPKQRSLIVSEKASMFEDQIEVLKNYKVGDVVEGKITGIVDFGAFIRFPLEKEGSKEALEGLIHISELDWQLLSDPSEVVKVGQKIKAKIIEITKGRISLSLKALKKDPWQEVIYQKGDLVEGEVIKFNPFGAFVKINPNPESKSEITKIQALCHISEFKNEREMKDAFEVGKKYKFQISLISPQEHKMILKPA